MVRRGEERILEEPERNQSPLQLGEYSPEAKSCFQYFWEQVPTRSPDKLRNPNSVYSVYWDTRRLRQDQRGGNMNSRFALRPIKTERDYKKALDFIDALFDAKAGTDQANIVEVLAILVEKYEEEHFPIESPDPVEAIKFRMEQSGFTTADLAKILGGRNRVSEVLNRKRRLSIEKVRKLSSRWKIPAESLLGP